MTNVTERAREIVRGYKGKEGVLVHVLQNIQGEFGYLPEEAVRVVSEELEISLAEIYGVASFYTRFYFVPRGKNIIRVCRGTACHVRGSGRILGKIEEGLGMKSGETTPDLKFTLETVNCVGCCALAPVVVINEKAQTVLNPERVLAALKRSGDNGQD
uniref:NADH-quinone oxidoreductase subunit NuoE n=1 Tax=Ammonifex degensii TaxID=42838 RepID=A0A7C2EJ08_9THEO